MTIFRFSTGLIVLGLLSVSAPMALADAVLVLTVRGAETCEIHKKEKEKKKEKDQGPKKIPGGWENGNNSKGSFCSRGILFEMEESAVPSNVFVQGEDGVQIVTFRF